MAGHHVVDILVIISQRVKGRVLDRLEICVDFEGNARTSNNLIELLLCHIGGLIVNSRGGVGVFAGCGFLVELANDLIRFLLLLPSDLD